MKSNFTAYWHIVLKCLTHLCKLSPAKARALVRSYRNRLLDTPEDLRRDIIFHMEPWQLAQRLAGQEDRKLKAAEQTWYEKTVRISTAEAAILGTEDEVREFQVA
jgi:hypothetical protein